MLQVKTLAAPELFDELRKVTGLKEKEKLVVFYHSMDNCYKCSFEIQEVINIAENNQDSCSAKIVIMVRCQRDKELDFYKNEYDWGHYYYKDDGQSYKKLKSDITTGLIIFDYNFNPLIKLDCGNIYKNLDLIKNLL